MPELPEVELVRRAVDARWVGGVLREVRVLDPSVVRGGDIRALVGARVVAASRRGKHLLVRCAQHDPAGVWVVCVHLRMTGRFEPAEGRAEAMRVVFSVEHEGEGRWSIDGLRDVRRLGHVTVWTEAEAERALEAMGPEPWPEPLGAEVLKARLKGTRRAIKVALMDQAVVAGVGNIVAAESLWRAGIDPRRPARELSDVQLGALSEAVCDVCEGVMVAEDGPVVRYFGGPGGPSEVGYLDVYGRAGEPCRRSECGGRVARLKQSGRSTYWCPSCQLG